MIVKSPIEFSQHVVHSPVMFFNLPRVTFAICRLDLGLRLAPASQRGQVNLVGGVHKVEPHRNALLTSRAGWRPGCELGGRNQLPESRSA